MALISGFTDYVVPFLIILTILVFVHEMGHYLAARWNQVRVEVFSIGFGPELFGWNDRHGTRWRLSAIPLGGYVKMLGDGDAASTEAGQVAVSAADRPFAFQSKRLGQRAAIVAAGPIANFLFAILVLSGLYIASGQPYTLPIIDAVVADSPAERAGIQIGDTVTRIDHTAVDRFETLQRYVQARPGQVMAVTLERDGKPVTLTMETGVRVLTDRFGNEQKLGILGVQSNRVQVVRHDPLTAVWRAGQETWDISVGTLHALGQMVAGTRDTKEIGGVLRIAQMSGEVTRDGLLYAIWFVALLSINLGLINLMPIPVLDGGHLLFYAAEAVRGRPLGRRVQEYGAMAGLAAVLALMVFATWNDLVHLRVVAFLTSLVS